MVDSSKPSTSQSDKDQLAAADFQATQDAAVKAAPTSVDEVNPGNNLNPTLEVGQDKDFNAFVKQAHLSGNPEQWSPMQAAQNVRDAAQAESQAGVNRIDDPKDEATRWVAENVKGEPVQE